MRFGIEKIGIWCARTPWAALLLILALSAAAGWGVSRTSVDDSLTELFRSDTAEFKQYERLDSRFPSSEYDVLVIIEGQKLLTREGLEALRNMALELQFVDAAKGLVSLFSARAQPVGDAPPAPLVPDELPADDAEFARVVETLRSNGIIKDRLLSPDGTLTLAVIALDKDKVAGSKLDQTLAEIEKTAREQAEPAGLKVTMSGVPVMQQEIRNAVNSDRLLYNGVGFGLGALICLAFFRRVSLTVLAILGPAAAVLWGVGALGLLDFRLNLFLNVITPLVMVIAFADTMHLLFAIRRELAGGQAVRDAVAAAVSEIGPASFITSITNWAAFISLIFSDSALIRSFGYAGMIATTLVFFAVIIVVPTFSVLILRRRELSAASGGENPAIGALTGTMAGFARLLRGAAPVWLAAGIALTAGLAWVYVQLSPQYRLADQVPDREQAVAGGRALDAKLTGANPIHVLMEWQGGGDLYEPRRLEAIARVHQITEATAGLGNVWSLYTLQRWLAEGGENRVEILKSYMDVLPAYLTERFVAKAGDAVVVTGRVPDVDISGLVPIVDRLDKSLAPVRAEYPELAVSVTGLPAIAARNSARMIEELNLGMFADVLVACAIIALVFRSLTFGMISFLPNVLPIVAAGSLLYVLGVGLQFASVVALTVAFGLAIDNVVHTLWRLRTEDEAGAGPEEAVDRTVAHISPVIIMATLVLVAGLAMPIFSSLPSLRLFGALSGTVLVFAVVGCVVLLPATLYVMRRFTRRPTQKLPEASQLPQAHLRN